MQPDYDQIRHILLKIEEAEARSEGTVTDTDRQKHLRLIHDAYLFDGADLRGHFVIHRTTPKGREVIEMLKNDRVFAAAKQATAGVEGTNMTIFADVARSAMRQIVQEKSGLDMASQDSKQGSTDVFSILYPDEKVSE